MSDQTPSVVNQSVQSANSPEVVTLRTSGDTVPPESGAYRIDRATIAEVASASTVVSLQNYDDDNVTVEREVHTTVGSDATVTLDPDGDDAVLSVERGNQIRVATGSDVEVTLYLVPDDV